MPVILSENNRRLQLCLQSPNWSHQISVVRSFFRAICLTKKMVASNFKQFCNSTTAHGFSHLEASSTHTRTCWIFILVLAFVAGALHLYTIINEYLEFNYHETTIISTDVYPLFPDITICDNSGISEVSIAK